MKTPLKLTVVLAVLVFCVVQGAEATLLNFDTVYSGSSAAPIPNGYGGLNWMNFDAIERHALPGSGFDLGTVSGNYSAFNGPGSVAVITGDPFDFVSAYLTAGRYNGITIDIQGWKGGLQTYDRSVVVDATGPTYFTFNFSNIDMLHFWAFGDQFVMDDFTFQPSVPAPEPISMVMLGCLGAGMAGARKLRRRK